ncbi:MAG TPA: GNAT family N-acetyltransferase [Candidatus Saccharimonadales bacterium]|nr:GNAT family N-acetyltransferase [Candidatus Saccharimonadales bacterium]
MYSPEWPMHTERLLLRPFEERDLQALHTMQSDVEVVRYLYHDVRSLDDVRIALARKMGSVSIAGEGDHVNAAVVLRDSGELVADVSLWLVSEGHEQAELGFVVHPAHQRKGYATEASRPLLDFAFNTMHLHRVVGRLEARNAGSARVLEKLGMRREAHFVENEWVKGEWQSEYVYALLAEEWAAQASARPTGSDMGH